MVPTSPQLITRLGVPLIVVVFYITASLQFSYTPEATYSALREAEKLQAGIATGDHVIGLPWYGLAAGAAALHIDPVISAKVFSLLFCSMAVVLAFFLVFELTGDMVIGLCGALTVASQEWLIRAAAGGSATSLVFVLVLFSLYFAARNEYLLAVLCASVGALAQWELLGLVPVIAIDAVANARAKYRGMMIAFAVTLVALAVDLPWVLAASWWNLPVLPAIPSAGNMLSAGTWVSFGIMTLLALSGVLACILRQKNFRGLPDVPGLWLGSAWLLCAGVLFHHDLLVYAMAIMVTLGFVGLQRLVRQRQGNEYGHGVFVFCTALLLAAAQTGFYLQSKPTMDAATQENEDLTAIAYWLQSSGEVVHTHCDRRPATLSYLLHYDVPAVDAGSPATSPVVVSPAEGLGGYEIAYTPGGPTSDDPGVQQHRRFSVWRKK